MLSLGPFPLPAVLLVLATGVALLVAKRFGQRADAEHAAAPSALPQPRISAGNVLLDMLVIGVVAARLGFVLQWSPQYLADPWAILRIGDGGFTGWVGVLGGVAWGAWKARKRPELRRPLLVGTLSGLGAWAALTGTLWQLQQAGVALPTTTLATLADEPITLSRLSGKPMVLNLWATWCPPCRREMPALAAAQQRHPGVNFVFVNQGEDAALISQYLDGENLDLRNVLRDPFSKVMHEVGSRGLPTTLFFDADGRLVDTHMGELSEASLGRALQRFRASAPTVPAIATDNP